MSPKNAVVVVIDRLGTLCLGPYGNTWMDTPGWNRLAADSLLCEQMLVDSPDLPTVYRSYWRGLHAMCPPTEAVSLAEQLRAGQVRSALLTDEPELAASGLAADFDEHVRPRVPPARKAAREIERTQLARCMVETLDKLARLPEPSLLWVHLRGMQGPWDAPTEVRHQFADEEDPRPGDFVEPPGERLSGPADPDRLLTLTHAYAGQVVVLDACLAALDDAVRQSYRADRTLLAVTSCRGFPLGEHGRIGPCDDPLFNELLHVPCILRHPDPGWAGCRVPDPVQPADLHATLIEWFDLAPGDPPAAAAQPANWGYDLFAASESSHRPRRLACSIGPGQRSIRTPGWFLRAAEYERPQLFVKPDDLWEVNQVAELCPDILERLEERLEQFQAAAGAGRPETLKPLPPELLQSD